MPDSAIRPSCSRRAAETPTIMAFAASMAWVRALTAALRATLRCLIISTSPVPALQSRGLPAEHGAGGAFGIEMVRLAMPVAPPAIGPASLTDGMARRMEKAGQAGAIRARALDAKGAGGSQ